MQCFSTHMFAAHKQRTRSLCRRGHTRNEGSFPFFICKLCLMAWPSTTKVSTTSPPTKCLPSVPFETGGAGVCPALAKQGCPHPRYVPPTGSDDRCGWDSSYVNATAHTYVGGTAHMWRCDSSYVNATAHCVWGGSKGPASVPSSDAARARSAGVPASLVATRRGLGRHGRNKGCAGCPGGAKQRCPGRF